ncbi:hypothetical protein KUV85_13165 [Nocardioides panacisoli]|uniref:hypothetical protein n=1 Tax=Nocardioides panacisoli TaxID=627624 RepID=UPI001C627BD0|nr:hypothetical protein [Nocardioides panacisoli]QYJ03277.1 hypothetical protein KUV85_13165 [Nocardioides panacisoli]
MADPAPAPTPPTPRQLVFVTGLRGRAVDATVEVLRGLGGRPSPAPDPPEGLVDSVGPAAWARELHDGLARRYGLRRPETRPDSLLAGAHASYDNEAHRALDRWLRTAFDEADEVVVDDPWFPWLVSLWQVAAGRAGAAIRIVVVVDDPAEHAAAEAAADDAYPEVALAAEWTNTMLTLERATRDEQRCFVSYADLVADWTLTVKNLGDALDLAFVQQAAPGQMIRASEAAPTRPETPRDWSDLAVPADIAGMADATRATLLRLAADRHDAEALAEADRLRARFTERHDLAAATVRSSIIDGVKMGRRGATR